MQNQSKQLFHNFELFYKPFSLDENWELILIRTFKFAIDF